MAGIFHLKYNHPTKLHLAENLSNCRDVAQDGFNKSGIFNITLPQKSLTPVSMWYNLVFIRLEFQVYCDFETDGGDWLVSFICTYYCQCKIKIKMKIRA